MLPPWCPSPPTFHLQQALLDVTWNHSQRFQVSVVLTADFSTSCNKTADYWIHCFSFKPNVSFKHSFVSSFETSVSGETALVTMISPPQLSGLVGVSVVRQRGLDWISSPSLLYTLERSYNRKYCVKECWICFQKWESLFLLLPFSLKLRCFQSSPTKLIPESPRNIKYFHRWISP